jgi:hypothetical protein
MLQQVIGVVFCLFSRANQLLTFTGGDVRTASAAAATADAAVDVGTSPVGGARCNSGAAD